MANSQSSNPRMGELMLEGSIFEEIFLFVDQNEELHTTIHAVITNSEVTFSTIMRILIRYLITLPASSITEPCCEVSVL